jgi:two-component SAPR family response regulator
MVMPEMTGIELADKVACLLPGLPIILSSGFAEMPLVAATRLTRLPKPFDQATLAKLISETYLSR